MSLTKADLEENNLFLKEQLKFCKEQIQMLKEEKDGYKLQIERLQNALFSVQAPQAYRDMQADKAEVPIVEGNQQAKDHQKQLTNIYKTWLHHLEEPLFKDPDDMERLLEGTILKTTNLMGKSLHENEES